MENDGAPKKVAEHPRFRFKCSVCEAVKDQGMMREDSTTIKCVCHEKAYKIAKSPDDPEERITWWTYPDGTRVPGKFTDHPRSGEAIAGMFSGGQPVPPKKTFIQRIFGR